MTIWTAEMNDYLRKLHAAGMVSRLVAVEINARFGVNITRNAAIGKQHRLGLLSKKKPSKPVSQKPKPRKPRRNLKKRPMPHHINGARAARAAAAGPPRRITLADLTKDTCRWPIGDPQQKDFYFCGKQAQTTSPYCKAHERDAYNIKATEKDRRRANAQAPTW